MMSPFVFPVILVLVGLFLVFSKNISLGFSRVLIRPNIFYAGVGIILLAVILWFILGYMYAGKSGQLMWIMPIGYIIAILLMAALSTKETKQVELSYEKSGIFSKSLLVVFIFAPFLIFAFVMTLVMSPVAAIILLILGTFAIVKFMKNKKK